MRHYLLSHSHPGGRQWKFIGRNSREKNSLYFLSFDPKGDGPPCKLRLGTVRRLWQVIAFHSFIGTYWAPTMFQWWTKCTQSFQLYQEVHNFKTTDSMALSWVTYSFLEMGECAQGDSFPYHRGEEATVQFFSFVSLAWYDSPATKSYNHPEQAWPFPWTQRLSAAATLCFPPLSKQCLESKEIERADIWIGGLWLPLDTGGTLAVPSWQGSIHCILKECSSLQICHFQASGQVRYQKKECW